MRDGTFCIACSSLNPGRPDRCADCDAPLRAADRTAGGPIPSVAVTGRVRRRQRPGGSVRSVGPRRAAMRIVLAVPLVAALGLGIVAASAQRSEESRFASRYAAAETAEQAGRYSLAASLFADAPGYRDADARAAAAQENYRVAVQAGAAALDAGQYDAAIALLDPLARQHPGDREITALLGQAHRSRANAIGAAADQAMTDGDWLGAERLYATLLADDPANTEIADRLAWIQREHAPVLIGREDGIYLIGPDLDDERQLVRMEATTMPVWSPDRTQIAFTVADEDQTLYGELYVVGSDGTDLKRLASRAAAFRGVSWSPDGTSIAFTSFADYDRRSDIGPVGLHLVDVGTGVETNLTESRWDYALSPSWSPDGARIAFVHRDLDPDENGGRDVGIGGVQVFELATGSFTDLTGDRLQRAWLVSWSPEVGSDRLMVQTRSDAIGYNRDPTDLFAVDAVTGETEAIHATRAVVTQAVWSPDGSRFAYIEDELILHVGFWQDGMLRQGSVRLDSLSSAAMTWSPDGSALLIAAPDGWSPSLLVRFTPTAVTQRQLNIEFRMDFSESAPPQWTSHNEPNLLPAAGGGTAHDGRSLAGDGRAPLDRQRR